MSAAQFRLELQREWAEKEDEIRDRVALLGLQGLRGVVNKSPVGNPSLWKEPRPGYVGGRFKGNWFLSVGAINETATTAIDPSGGATIARGATAVSAYASLEGFPMIHIQNNLPYGPRLEDGYSSQAPGGMVGLTVAELQAQWNAQAPV